MCRFPEFTGGLVVQPLRPSLGVSMATYSHLVQEQGLYTTDLSKTHAIVNFEFEVDPVKSYGTNNRMNSKVCRHGLVHTHRL